MEMNQMPIEMIEEILVALPVKTLLRFKCLCKHWRDVIESRRFVDRHCCHDSNRDRLVFQKKIDEGNGDGVNLGVGRGYFDYKCRMGPVNGVFCTVSARTDTIDLLNPASREVKRLPSLPPLRRPRRYRDLRVRYGFGLDPSTGDYKTVAFYGDEFACVHTSSSSLSISTSSSSDSSECWRFIEGVDPSLLSTSLGHLLVDAIWKKLCGGFCNGVYYWVCEGILAFDIITEKFREIEPPAGVVGIDIDFGGVGVYGGSTALFLLTISSSFSDMWVLGENGCWSKVFSFPIAAMCIPFRDWIPVCVFRDWIPVCVWKNEMVLENNLSRPICVWKNEMVLENNLSRVDCPNLITVDICTGRVTPLRLPLWDCGEGLLAAFSYKETLVSFKPNYKETLVSFKPKHVNLSNPSDVPRKRKRPTDVDVDLS